VTHDDPDVMFDTEISNPIDLTGARGPLWALAILAVVVAIWLVCWMSVSVTRADREYRSDAVKACETIENETTQAACIKEAG